MSQPSQSQVKEKEMVITITRYAQIIANYRNFDDAAVICKDMLLKGVPFVMSCNFIQ